MAKAPTTLGLAKIGVPGQPRAVRINIEANLAAELDRYVEAYAAEYGEKVELDVLIPHMLQSFVTADRGFKKWKTEQGRKPSGE